jgi:alginate O-acetyltransferase complex protein AlgI
MLFNSFEYLFFLPLVFLLYWFLFNKNRTLQNGLMLLASYFFYGWWSWSFIGLLMLSTLLDYLYGFGVASENRKRAKFFLWLSILNNLGILAVFKYYNFFAEQFQYALGIFHINAHPVFLNIILPVGISFYTFHGMSYVFDIYRKQQEPVKNFIDYGLFVCFFPLLVAGPIERANHLLPQIQKPRSFNYSTAVEGMRLILWGMAKKVVLADSLATLIDPVFNHYLDYDPSILILAAVGFSFQIYGDFSGYSDIALGTAKLFGFELLSNFRFPYFSRDIAEFWRRWHISLSSWFRDYLYIPLGGSKLGKSKAVRNTFIIFLVSGFWHGASWNFIVWGFIHACGFLPLLVLNKNRNNISNVVAQNAYFPTLKEFWQMLVTFIFVTFAWIFFRSPDMILALGFLKHLIIGFISKNAVSEHFEWLTLLGYIIPFLLIDWYLRFDERKLKVPKNKWMRTILYLIIFILVWLHFGKNDSSFIYFQF